MPNHCSNALTVQGPRSRVFDFCRDHYRKPQSWNPEKGFEDEKTVLDFSYCAPYPNGRVNDDSWYDWRVNNWGTKWNAYDISYLTFPEVINAVHEDTEKDFASIEYDFVTAWSPPAQWLDYASEKYPDLTFALAWFEPACDFYGATVLRAGDILTLEEGACSSLVPDDVDWNDDEASQDAWDQQVTAIEEKLQEIVSEGLTSADYLV
jgi:hypothetical protein